MEVGVAVGRAVSARVDVGVRVGVALGVLLNVVVGVREKVGVDVEVAVGVREEVGDCVGVTVGRLPPTSRKTNAIWTRYSVGVTVMVTRGAESREEPCAAGLGAARTIP